MLRHMRNIFFVAVQGKKSAVEKLCPCIIYPNYIPHAKIEIND